VTIIRQKPNKLVLFPLRLDDAVMEADQAWAASLRRTRHLAQEFPVRVTLVLVANDQRRMVRVE
jgi:hypothetical protein